jgi:hypothetical protein
VTSEQAALFAQVIPVIALAAGIELRSLAGRLVRELGQDDAVTDRWVRIWPAYLLAATLPVLAAAEMYCLTLVLKRAWHPPLGFNTNDTSPFMAAVAIATFVAFITPAWDAIQRVTIARWPSLSKRSHRYVSGNLSLMALCAVLFASGHMMAR